MSSKEIESSNTTRTGLAAVSFQQYQDVYNDIVGRTEKSTTYYYEPTRLTTNDLVRLFHILTQSMAPYTNDTPICNVTVTYSKDKTEIFSSFEKFELQGLNRNSCTVGVEIQMHFLAKLPDSREARAHTISIGFRSMVGLEEKFLSTKSTEAERKMFYNYDNSTARVEVNYVDLAVARNLEAQVDEWYSGLTKNNTSFLLRFASKLKDPAYYFTRIVTLAATSYSILKFTDFSTFDTTSFLPSITLILTVILIANVLALPLAYKVEKVLDKLRPYSSIHFSKSDEDVCLVKAKRTSFAYLYSLLAVVGNIAIGLATGLLGNYFFG